MVYIMAHRGASGICLENSKQAFSKAIEFKSDYIELDVRKCYTGELIVMHDSKVNRTTNGDGYVKNMSLEEIKKLILINGEKILTLDEALDFINDKCKLNIEIKSRIVDYDVADKVVESIKSRNLESNVVISSFNHKILRYIKHSSSDIKTAALFIQKKTPGVFLRRLHYVENFIRKTKHINADFMNLPHQFITNKIVSKAIENNLKVTAWTVNSDKIMSRIKDLGIYAIITDYPQRFKKN